jgi:hypothetical protein
MAEAPVEFDEAPGDEEPDQGRFSSYSEAVVHSTDWTTETIISQLRRGNIMLNPRFQRRDAWSIQQKSKFVESLIMGLPVPQIVLAENAGKRGTYLVLDGKQRLLSLLQYWGLGEGAKNRYALSGLQVLSGLNRLRLSDLEGDAAHSAELNALLNQTIRTVVIKNWPNTDFLHLVFLRLNTGSTKLSPQELRQALKPGRFTDWVDESASKSGALRTLMGLTEPDSRMRDTEILARYTCFRFFTNTYQGRMKSFLDDGFSSLNDQLEASYVDTLGADQFDDRLGLPDFEAGLETLMKVFGRDDVARRPGSRLLNRTLLDMLLFYARSEAVRAAMTKAVNSTKDSYLALFAQSDFVSAIESDTARVSNTALRLSYWGDALNEALGLQVPLPKLVKVDGSERIEIEGF